MRRKRNVLLLAAMILCTGVPTYANEAVAAMSETGNSTAVERSDELSNGFQFEKETGTITGYNGTIAELVIPAEIDGVAVTTIGKEAFSPKTTITSVSFPDTVEVIEESAFSKCSGIVNITFPSSLKRIEKNAFSGLSRLVRIDLPEGLQYIGVGAFQRCTGVTEVYIPTSVQTIEQNAFNSLAKLKRLDLPEGLEVIGAGAFSKNIALSEASFPTTLKRIKENAFEGCSKLKKIDLAEGLEEIKEGAFKGGLLTEVYLPQSLKELSTGAFSDNRTENKEMSIVTLYTYNPEHLKFEESKSHKIVLLEEPVTPENPQEPEHPQEQESPQEPEHPQEPESPQEQESQQETPKSQETTVVPRPTAASRSSVRPGASGGVAFTLKAERSKASSGQAEVARERRVIRMLSNLFASQTDGGAQESTRNAETSGEERTPLQSSIRSLISIGIRPQTSSVQMRTKEEGVGTYAPMSWYQLVRLWW